MNPNSNGRLTTAQKRAQLQMMPYIMAGYGCAAIFAVFGLAAVWNVLHLMLEECLGDTDTYHRVVGSLDYSLEGLLWTTIVGIVVVVAAAKVAADGELRSQNPLNQLFDVG